MKLRAVYMSNQINLPQPYGSSVVGCLFSDPTDPPNHNAGWDLEIHEMGVLCSRYELPQFLVPWGNVKLALPNGVIEAKRGPGRPRKV